MERQKKLSEALRAFQKQYPFTTSGDLQTFVLGTQACEEVMQSEIDDKDETIKNLSNYLVKCMGNEATLRFLGSDLTTEIVQCISNNLHKQEQVNVSEVKG